MKLRFVVVALLLVALIATSQVDAQKRRKGDKKKDSEATATDQKPKVEVKPDGGKQRSGRQSTTTTTTTTTLPTTTLAVVEEEVVEEEVYIVNEPRSATNNCPPELKPKDGESLTCTCRDQLDDNAVMVECVAATDAQQVHGIFNSLLLGKRIDAVEIRNSTLGPLVPNLTAQAYIGTLFMRGNGISEIPSDTFQGSDQNIGRLDLSSNQISRVNFSMFDTFTQLQVLNLAENVLTNIEDAGSAPSLRVLYLYSNRIDTISPKAFIKLEALEYLDLRWNNLQVLAPSALHVSSSRWQLRLRANQLATLDQAFSDENPPYLIDLSLNNIGYLHDSVFGPLLDAAIMEGSKIYLGGNPLQCDCAIAWIVKSARLLATAVGAKCEGDGLSFNDLSQEEFRKCPPPKPWKSPMDKVLAEFAKQ